MPQCPSAVFSRSFSNAARSRNEVWAPTRVGEDNWGFLAGKDAQEVEKNHIRVTLELTGGNRIKASAAMGISERTLYRKIRDYDIET